MVVKGVEFGWDYEDIRFYEEKAITGQKASYGFNVDGEGASIIGGEDDIFGVALESFL